LPEALYFPKHFCITVYHTMNTSPLLSVSFKFWFIFNYNIHYITDLIHEFLSKLVVRFVFTKLSVVVLTVLNSSVLFFQFHQCIIILQQLIQE
jgi:hypothetical protein